MPNATIRRRKVQPIVAAVVQPVARRLARIEASCLRYGTSRSLSSNESERWSSESMHSPIRWLLGAAKLAPDGSGARRRAMLAPRAPIRSACRSFRVPLGDANSIALTRRNFPLHPNVRSNRRRSEGFGRGAQSDAHERSCRACGSRVRLRPPRFEGSRSVMPSTGCLRQPSTIPRFVGCPSTIICAVPRGHLPRAAGRAGVAYLGSSEFGYSLRVRESRIARLPDVCWAPD